MLAWIRELFPSAGAAQERPVAEPRTRSIQRYLSLCSSSGGLYQRITMFAGHGLESFWFSPWAMIRTTGYGLDSRPSNHQLPSWLLP